MIESERCLGKPFASLAQYRELAAATGCLRCADKEARRLELRLVLRARRVCDGAQLREGRAAARTRWCVGSVGRVVLRRCWGGGHAKLVELDD